MLVAAAFHRREFTPLLVIAVCCAQKLCGHAELSGGNFEFIHVDSFELFWSFVALGCSRGEARRERAEASVVRSEPNQRLMSCTICQLARTAQ